MYRLQFVLNLPVSQPINRHVLQVVVEVANPLVHPMLADERQDAHGRGRGRESE